MKLIYMLFAVGLALMVGLGGLAIGGVSPFPNAHEAVPVSVRDNPSSWRPAYIGGTGYRSPSSSSSGSSGGYSGGK